MCHESKSTGQVGGPVQNAKTVKKVSGSQIAKKKKKIKKKNLILQEQKSSLEKCHTSKENRIKEVFKTNVKEVRDITRGPHTYQHENATSVPQHPYEEPSMEARVHDPNAKEGNRGESGWVRQRVMEEVTCVDF